jgi:hypothetical protein
MSFFTCNTTNMLLNNWIKFSQQSIKPKSFPLLSSYRLLLLPWNARLCFARYFTIQTILNKTFLQWSVSFSSRRWAGLSIVWSICNLLHNSYLLVVIFKTRSALVLCSLSLVPGCIQSLYPYFANWLLEIIQSCSLRHALSCGGRGCPHGAGVRRVVEARGTQSRR